MQNLNTIYIDFIAKFKEVLLFISENFGDKDILIRKNQGFIKARNFEIKNSPIKGYAFHGTGCGFKFKNGTLDIEFASNNIGFTNWSFYSYSKNINIEFTEIEIETFLKEKLGNKELKFNGIFFELI